MGGVATGWPPFGGALARCPRVRRRLEAGDRSAAAKETVRAAESLESLGALRRQAISLLREDRSTWPRRFTRRSLRRPGSSRQADAMRRIARGYAGLKCGPPETRTPAPLIPGTWAQRVAVERGAGTPLAVSRGPAAVNETCGAPTRSSVELRVGCATAYGWSDQNRRKENCQPFGS